MTTWEALRSRLEIEVFRRGLAEVAREVPAHPVTVYRIVTGRTAEPSKAIRAGIERVIDSDATESCRCNRHTR